jgi:hypothetical protein
MRDLLTEGISLLLQREGLPALPLQQVPHTAGVIEISKKTGA